ncbi:MAG TPA: alpha-D-ribose 1-methylphosphonate 5-triphosphate diphosphatase, partial [Ruminiclostridium sp.]
MKAIINGKIVTPTNILEDCVLVIKDNIIETIINKNEFNQNDFKTIIDAKSRYIMPGFIDTHSDKIEQIIQPRPTSIMDFEIALKEVERQLINQGITTMYHSISLFKDDYFGVSHLRHKENVLKLSELINNIHKRNHLIHHRFHLRIEIDNLDAFDVAYNMILEKKVHQISFMDHTPGQGQYR